MSKFESSRETRYFYFSLAYDELMSYFSDSFVLSFFSYMYLVINPVFTCNSCEIVIFPQAYNKTVYLVTRAVSTKLNTITSLLH